MAVDAYSAILRRLAWLRANDRRWCRPDRLRRVVWGAYNHGYATAAVSEEDVRRLESDVSATLPDAFRTFLIRVGWGAGPNDGISSVDGILHDTERIAEFAEAAGRPRPRPAEPFPYTAGDLERHVPEGPWIKADAWVSGYLPISDKH